MVLEAIVTAITAEKRPVRMFFYGALFSSIALFLSVWIFEEQSSLVMIFLTTMALIPLTVKTMEYEEEKDVAIDSETSLLVEHARAVSFLVFLFLGSAFAFTLWYVVLPAELSAKVFSIQSQTILNINQQIVTGNVAQASFFSKILLNNIKVLIFCILFSFLYGSGSIFILLWNASVIGTALGNFIKTKIGILATTAGFSSISHYFTATSFGLLRYLVHGIPEIIAYFVAGLAGGIISVAVMRNDLLSKRFSHILFDVADLVLLSVVILFVAGLLEVYVTPMFF